MGKVDERPLFGDEHKTVRQSVNINVIKAQTDRLLNTKRVADCANIRLQDV